MFHGRLIRSATLWTLLAAIVACAGGSDAPSAPPSSPPPPPDTSSPVLLKDIVISSLPAPYYHFEYDASGEMTGAAFASGLTMYDLTYAGGRLSELRSNVLVNHDRLVYDYDEAGRVSIVKYTNAQDTTFAVVFLDYVGRQLKTLERDRRVEGGWIVEKTMSFTYGADGNVSDVTEHHPAIAGMQDATTVTDHYADYDTGTNVDGFSLIHSEFFDHLVLLPLVQLQKSNPRTVTRSGDGENYRVEYAYSYDARNRPLARNGVITILNGPNAGQQIPSTTTFSYYASPAR